MSNPLEIQAKLDQINQAFTEWYRVNPVGTRTWNRQRNFLMKELVKHKLLDLSNSGKFWKAYNDITNLTGSENGHPYGNGGLRQRAYFEQLVWWCQDPAFHNQSWDDGTRNTIYD